LTAKVSKPRCPPGGAFLFRADRAAEWLAEPNGLKSDFDTLVRLEARAVSGSETEVERYARKLAVLLSWQGIGMLMGHNNGADFKGSRISCARRRMSAASREVQHRNREKGVGDHGSGMVENGPG
jgi:hypothetical protein